MSDPVESVPVTAEKLPISRARRLAATCVGVVLAVAGGMIGWMWLPPLYRSAGWIEVQPQIPRILHATDENRIHPMFDAYMQTQVALAASRRVTDMAMDSPEWKKLGRERTDEEIERFRECLSASRPPRGLYVEVAFRDEDQQVAMTAVNSVMDAYMKLVNEQEVTGSSGTLRVLENKRTAYNNQLADLRATVQTVTEDLGTDGFAARSRMAMERLSRIEAALVDFDLQAARAGAGAPSDELRDQRDRILTLRTAAEDEVRRLGKKGGQLAQLDAERANVESMLGEVKRRLDEINVEASGAMRGRIRIASNGDRPVTPEPDRRRRVHAAIGAAAGFLVGFFAILLTARRRAA
jgi:uncharacterized protein involved in exopolysaccharide biosynthesis